MNSYILTLVLKPDLEEKARQGILDSVKSGVDTVSKEDLWGNKDLAYKVKKQTKGYYAHLEFQAEAAKIPVLDNKLKLEEDVIRYLLIKR